MLHSPDNVLSKTSYIYLFVRFIIYVMRPYLDLLIKVLGMGILASIPLAFPLLRVHLHIVEIIHGLMEALIIGGLTGFLSGIIIKSLKLTIINVLLSTTLSIFLSALVLTYPLVRLYPMLSPADIYPHVLLSIIFGANFLIAPITFLTYLIFSLAGSLI